jgi:hypothetical protein
MIESHSRVMADTLHRAAMLHRLPGWSKAAIRSTEAWTEAISGRMTMQARSPEHALAAEQACSI